MVYRIPLLIFLLLYGAWVGLTYRDYGVAIDEPMEYGFGEMLYNRNFGRDPQLLHDFAYEGENSREIWSHNHFQVMLLYIINNTGSLEVYHGLNLLFASLGFWLAYEIILLKTHTPWLALIGPVMLFFTPRFIGDVPTNVKDPVFAIYYLLALYMIMLAPRLKPWWVKISLLGVTFGLAAASRTIGYSIILVYMVMVGWELFKKAGKLKVIGKTVAEFGLIFSIMVGVHAVEMPFIASDPGRHLLRLMAVARAFPWQGTIKYAGSMATAGHLPWHYLFGWMIVTTPLLILGLGIYAHVVVWKDRVIQVLLLAFWLNIGLYFIFKPIIYDGIRHYLFVLVLLTILAAVVWVKLWERGNKPLRIFLGITLGLSVSLTGIQYGLLHPYEYTYFNELVGYLPGAERDFETDYWGTSYSEGARWLLEREPTQAVVVGLCGNEYAKRYFEGSNYQVVWISGCDAVAESGAKYVMAYGRNNEWDKVPGNVVYAVTRMGVPLMKIFQLD